MKKYLFIIFLFITANMFSQNIECDQLVNQGFEFLTQGNLNFAIDKYNEALKFDANKLEAHYGLGVAYSAICLKDGSLCNEAITHFLKVEELESGYRFSYRNIATCYIKTFQFTKAITYCDKAIEQNSKDGESYFYRGIAYNQSNNINKGCLDLHKALDLGYLIAEFEIKKYCK